MIRAGALLCLLLALPGAPLMLSAYGQSETTRAMIDSGHVGAVRWLEFDDRRGILFSSGDDGTVRLWDPAAGNLLRTLEVTQVATGRVAVSPAASRLAVVVTDGSSSSLAVWDWEQERQLYRIPLKEEPRFLRFSPLGTYLMYGESSWQGFSIIRVDDGTRVSFHPEGFGSVGFAEMSRSEKTLMTYEVSGRITYWDFTSGSQTRDVPTVPYLSAIRISPDRSVIVGFTSSQIVRIDAVTGAVRGRAAVAAVTSLDLSPAGNEISCIPGPGQQPVRWSVSGDTLVSTAGFPPIPGSPSLLVYGSSGLYFAGAAGGLRALTAGGDLAVFGTDTVARLTGFDEAAGKLALGSWDWIRVLAIEGVGISAEPTAIHTLLTPNPFSGPVGLAFLDGGRLLAWSPGSNAPGLAVLDTASLGVSSPAQPPAFVPLASPFHAPLSGLEVSSAELVGVENGGTVRLADPRTGVSRFDSRIAGADTAVRVSDGELVAGRNAAGVTQGSLVRLNMTTGETLTLHDRNLFTYSLLLDPGAPGGPALYSIGIDAARSTNLLRHDGPGFDRETLLDSVAEEDLDAGLSLDPDRHVLYATLGRDRVVSWDGKTLSTLAFQDTVPRRLVVRSGLAFCLNKDSTITIVDSVTGARKAQVALFQDGEWCMILADGHYAASTGGDLRVRVFSDGSPIKATEDYRLRIETR